MDAITSIEPDDEEGDRARREATRFNAMPAAYQSAVYSSTLDNQTRTYSNAEPPPGSTIIKDPYEIFLSTAPVGRRPNLLTVAKETSALRSILPLINHHQLASFRPRSHARKGNASPSEARFLVLTSLPTRRFVPLRLLSCHIPPLYYNDQLLKSIIALWEWIKIPNVPYLL